MTDDNHTPRVAVVGAGEASSLEQLLRALPPTFGYALIVSSPLSAEQARAASQLPVEIVNDGAAVLQTGRVYVVPQDHRVRMEHGRLVAAADGPARHFDSLLRS